MERFHIQNCLSFLNMAKYWAGAHDWDRAIEHLKAAIRCANRAGALRTSGMALVAIRRCQDAKKHYEAMAPEEAAA